MSKSDAFELDLLRLLFNGTAIAGLADNAAAAPATNLYVSLHTADPSDAGNQSTSEVAYGGYARVAVARSGGGWAVSQAAGITSVAPVSPISFPPGTSGLGVAPFFGIGMAPNGAGKLLYSGPCLPPLIYGNGATPVLSTATNVTED